MTESEDSLEQTTTDKIYIDCEPIDVIGVDDSDDETERANNISIFQEIFNNSSSELNVNFFNNTITQTILAVLIFIIILVSGNYVFYTLPKSRLEKAINKDMLS